MSQQIAKSTNPSGGFLAALNAPPDYSEAFTAEVTSLARVITDVVDVPVEHDDDMNYGSAQKLVISLDAACQLLPPRDSRAAYRLCIYISSKGPYFAFVTLKLSKLSVERNAMGPEKPSQFWLGAADENLPEKIRAIQQTIAAALKSKHYSLLEVSVLSQEAEGHLTELDGKQATVFEVLFSEVI